MFSGRFFLIFMAMFAIQGVSDPGRAEAFWGFGSERNSEKSGLDFNTGYDVNTVSTVSGRAVAAAYRDDSGNMVIEIKSGGGSGSESVFLGVGPSSYWQKNGVAINPEDEISVRGSKAVGKDGKTYLFTRKLVNRTTGSEIELRSEIGDAAWMKSGQVRPVSPPPSLMNRGGGMNRSGAGTMRGGGAGMRR